MRRHKEKIKHHKMHDNADASVRFSNTEVLEAEEAEETEWDGD